MKNSTISIIIVLFFGIYGAHSQYTTTKIKSKHQAYTDSLKQVDYRNIFPVFGKKAYKKGFDIPYPTGVMFNYFYAKQGLIIDNLQLGLDTPNQNIPLTDVDFLEFGDNISTVNNFMIRPDLWVFPFLNVYGIFAVGTSSTEVNLMVPIELKSVVDQSVQTTGFGGTAAGGIGPVWIAFDGNITWTKPELVEESVKVTTFGIRFGHTFTSKVRPDRNFSIWAGAMKASIGATTKGAIKLKDALPPEVFDRAAEIEAAYFEWYNSLNPNNPLDAIKIAKADQILTPIFERIGAADGESVISYSLDKRVKQEWNGVIGAQYQLNKNWILRSEGGIIGDRKSFLLSLNYRFLL